MYNAPTITGADMALLIQYLMRFAALLSAVNLLSYCFSWQPFTMTNAAVSVIMIVIWAHSELDNRQKINAFL
ncbi:DUF3021 family protein [Salmonella enterica subsp. enterica]|nr:DUF3021 family protein [Salmonella enterica subsp. enterica serovar Oranienburg]